MSKRSVGISTVFTPRATWVSWWTPAPCESGATTSEASAEVRPGIRSQRWLVTTKAIWPWVSTAAFGRPVVPEVKKNQQGSSRSTGDFGGRLADVLGDERVPGGAEAGLADGDGEAAARRRRRASGKAALQIMPVAPEACAR